MFQEKPTLKSVALGFLFNCVLFTLFNYLFDRSWSLALEKGAMFGVLMIAYRYILWHAYFKKKVKQGDI